MELILASLIAANFGLGIALFVASVAKYDREYARKAREEEDYKTYFRTGRTARRPDNSDR